MFFAPRDPRAAPTALPRSALVFAAVGAGFVIARQLGATPSGAWLSVACSACALAGLMSGRACRIAILLAAVAFGAGWFALRIHEAPARSFEILLGAQEAGAPVAIEGVVLDRPRITEAARDPLHPMAHLQEPGVRFWLAADSARAGGAGADGATVPARGRVRVVLTGRSTPELRAGDRARVTGEFRPVTPPMNPGEADRRLWAAQDGESGTLRVPSGALIERLEPAPGALGALRAAWLSKRDGMREHARAALLGDSAGAGPERRALIGALLLGEEEPALRDVRSAFTRLGLAHVLAISGFHLTVMAAVILLVLRLTGDRGWVEPALVALLVAAYLFILPVQAPIWRSGLMTLGLLAADALGRRYDPLAMLGWIAVALVLWRPMDLWSMGFQLSFGLVGVLMWLGQTTYRRMYGVVYAGVGGPQTARPRTMTRWLWDEGRAYVSSSLLCWVVAAPLVAFHTGLVSMLGLVASLVLLPPILVLLGLGYAALALGMIFPSAGAFSGEVLDWVSGWTLALVRWMDGFPYASFQLPALSLAWAAAATVLALYWFARGHARDWLAWIGAFAACLWLALEVRLGPRLSPGVLLRIDTLAVGDGACHLIRSGREAVLWDCGSLTPGVGRRLVPRAVRALGTWRVPTVVISHPSLDHYNGLLDAARPLGVRRVVVSECFQEQAARQPAGAEAYVLAGLRERGIRVDVARLGDELALGRARMTFIAPPGPEIEQAWPNENDRSFVGQITVRAGGTIRRALMTGDIEIRAIEHLGAVHPGLRADIMEAPHHGSAKDPAIKFVAGVDPAVVLQSTGPSRAGDARWNTVRASPHRDWYTTALEGAAWAEVRGDGSIRSGAMWKR